MITNQRVRLTVTDGMGRKQVHEATFSTLEKTPSIAAKELIDGALILRDGDTIEVSFSPVMVNCLVFGDDDAIVLGSECRTQEDLRVLLSDRIANGEAFEEERCAHVPADEYDRAMGRGSRVETTQERPR